MNNLLLIGCGDIGSTLADFLDSDWQCFGLRRNTAALPNNISPIAADLTKPESLACLANVQADAVVITLTPLSYSKSGYEAIFIDGLTALLPWLIAMKPARVLMASSTSVYHQNDDGWIDEASSTHPDSFSGKAVLVAEQLLLNSGLPATIVRFSGIYGPGRHRLLERVREGRCTASSDDRFSNRIHRDDCAAIFAHLLQLEKAETRYLASDGNPALQSEVEQWLAARLGVAYQQEDDKPATKSRTGSKRCRNQKLLDSGYVFKYPNYQLGYDAVIKALE